MPKHGYYAVQTGRRTGVYLSWDECEEQVKNFPGARFKKFATVVAAEAFVNGHGVQESSSTTEPASVGLSPAPPPEILTTHAQNKTHPLSPKAAGQHDGDVVYCDGACKGNGQKTGSIAGIGVWWGPNDARNLSERCPGDQTNNRAELVAITRVLETAPTKRTPLQIKTDSQYSRNCFESWLPKWQANGYRTAGGQPVKNLDLILYINILIDARRLSGQKVDLKYVRGHSGIVGNEAADALANQGTLMPPEPERDWKTLEEEVRRKLTAAQEPQHIDFSLYADSLLDEDELWKDLED